MKTEPLQMSLGMLSEERKKINTNSKYQRPDVWKPQQQQDLIDSILRGYDIPKMYVKEETGEFDYEVIDGKQRLKAIWDFFDGEITLPRNAKAIEGIAIKSQKYEDLDKKLRRFFYDYKIDFVVVKEARNDLGKDEIGELFLRLQNGTPLNPQEERNAMPGNMKKFIKGLAGIKNKKDGHKFFKSIAMKNTRYSHDQLAAQLTLLEMSLEVTGSPTNISTTTDLNNLYKKEIAFDENEKAAKKIKRTLDYLHKAFPSRNDDLVQHSVVTLYCLSSKLLKNYVSDGTENLLRNWFEEFEKERSRQDKLDKEQKDSTLLEYKNCTVGASTGYSSINKRLEIMEERFFESAPDIVQKDETRNFRPEQRLAIFRRDKAKCQICSKNLNFYNDYEADHIVPHSKGGQTTVSNGQATCKSCNGSKSNKQ